MDKSINNSDEPGRRVSIKKPETNNSAIIVEVDETESDETTSFAPKKNPPKKNNTQKESKLDRKPHVIEHGTDLYHRTKFYNTLSVQAGGELDIDEIPQHILPPNLFFNPYLQSTKYLKEGEYQSSILTIFTIWNTMMGSSLLALPWGFQQAGLPLSLGITILIAALSLYSCHLIVKHGFSYDDFSDVVKIHLGTVGQIIAFIASVSILIGATIAYDILMSDALYSNVNSIRHFAGEKVVKDSKYWNSNLAPLPIFVAVFSVSNLKNFSILVKVNAFGILCVLYVLGFIVIYSLGWKHIDHPSNIPLFESKFYYLAGLLMVSFFIHNCILPILKKNNPIHNTRDLILSFALVCISYLLIGGIVFLAYFRESIPQDFLTQYSQDNIGAFIARFALLFQLFTVYPLLLFIIRIQVFGTIWKNQWPGRIHVVVLNFLLCATGTVFSIFYPNIGTVLRFAGAISGFLFVFLLPCLVHLRITYVDKTWTIPSVIGNGCLIAFGLALFGSQFIL